MAYSQSDNRDERLFIASYVTGHRKPDLCLETLA